MRQFRIQELTKGAVGGVRMGGIVVIVVHMTRFTFVVQIRMMEEVVVQQVFVVLKCWVSHQGGVNVEIYMTEVGVVVHLKEDCRFCSPHEGG